MRRLLLAITLVALALPALFASRSVQAAETTDITVHKRIYRDARLDGVDNWQFDNGGQEIECGTLCMGLNGVHLQMYDASTLYERAKQDGEDETTFAQRLVGMNHETTMAFIDKYALQPVGTEVVTSTIDGEDGVAHINVPTYKDGKGAAYMLVETAVDDDTLLNVDLHNKSASIYMRLPVRTADGSLLSPIHIYPKNVGYVRDPYFFKYGVRLDGSQVRLQGAIFAMYQRDAAGNKLYLDLSPETDLKNKWIRSSNPLTDPHVQRFTSDKNGLVDTGPRFFPSGTYYFEELQSVDGYTNNLADDPVTVEIPKSWYDEDGNYLSVTINGQPMEETLNGIVTEAAITKGRPRVYNYQKATAPGTDTGAGTEQGGTTPGTTKPTTPTGMLPSMGTAATWLAIIGGLMLVILAWLLWRKRRQVRNF